jgi:hypothetical protein
MLVVIDTNLLHGDYLFRNAQLRVVLGEQALGYEVAISEATLFEHAKHYVNERLDVAKLMRKLDGDCSALEDIGYDQARRRLKERATAAGLKILPLPKVDHAQVLGRAQRGHKPFAQDGRTGYADTLIWETIIEAAGTQPVILLSNDGDFGNEGLDAVLEAEGKGLAHGIAKRNTFRQFISEYVDPKRKILEQLQRELVGSAGTAKRAVLERAVAGALRDLRISPKQAGLSAHYSRVDIGPPTSSLELRDLEVRPLGSTQLHLRMVFIIEAPVVAEYWFQDSPQDDPESLERDWDDFTARLLVQADAVASEDLGSVESVTITSVEEAEPYERDEHGE